MKTVTGRVISEEPISLSKAATILSGFVSSENEATQDVSAYLRRASAAFTELKNFHREIRSVKPKSETRHERNLTDELEEVSLAKGIDDLVESGDKIRSRESETVTLEESIRGREQDEAKEHKKKKKSKENKEEDVVDEKVNVKLEEEQSNGERKESKNEKKKKKKSKKNKEEDVIDEKVNVKLEEEQRSEERKERKKEKKKRKSDGDICSEERKSKKMRKSKEIEG